MKEKKQIKLGIIVAGAAGMTPWSAQTGVYFIDPCALTDPYLARMPALFNRRIGHYRRHIPQGYIASLSTGKNSIRHAAMASLYDDVALATRAPLFSKERWKSVWRLHSQSYGIHLEDCEKYAGAFPEYFGVPYMLGLPPAFSPFLDESRIELGRVTTLQYALVHEDAAAWQGLLDGMARDVEFKADITAAARWFLFVMDVENSAQEAKLIALLNAGADINEPLANKHVAGYRLLDFAVFSGNIGAIKALLNWGADVNATDTLGETALMKAAQQGDIAAAKLLLAHGADMVEKGKDKNGRVHGRTALMYAAWHGRKEMVQFLIDQGADINAAGALSGETALTNAARRGHIDIVRMLLDKGADVNAVMKNASTALGLALSGKGNVPARNREMISLLLERGADASAALADAARSGSLKSVQFLVGKGAAVNFADDPYGSTPLMHAAWYGHKKIVAFLLAEKAAVNMANKYGNTELWHAAAHERTAIVKLLIKKGADIDKANHAGITPLMEASLRGHTDTVRLLLASDADVHLKNNKGETALQLAAAKKHYAIAAMLQEAGAQ